MPTNDSELATQARKLLDAIAFTPFEQCQPLTREFDNIPRCPGIYAIRHKTDGLLYIGKTKSLRGRFSGGHKAFIVGVTRQVQRRGCADCTAIRRTLGKSSVIIGARSCHFQGNKTSVQRSNSNRKVKPCKPNFKNNFLMLMLKSF